MKLWVDDERQAPKGWMWAKTCQQAIDILESFDDIDEVALDHDLGELPGGVEHNTRPIVFWFIENGIWPDKITVHSSNPPGKEWLEQMIERYYGEQH